MMAQDSDDNTDPAHITREQEFQDRYDPDLDEPIEPIFYPPRYRVRFSPRFIQQVRELGSPRFPLAPVADA